MRGDLAVGRLRRERMRVPAPIAAPSRNTSSMIGLSLTAPAAMRPCSSRCSALATVSIAPRAMRASSGLSTAIETRCGAAAVPRKLTCASVQLAVSAGVLPTSPHTQRAGEFADQQRRIVDLRGDQRVLGDQCQRRLQCFEVRARIAAADLDTERVAADRLLAAAMDTPGLRLALRASHRARCPRARRRRYQKPVQRQRQDDDQRERQRHQPWPPARCQRWMDGLRSHQCGSVAVAAALTAC